MRQQERMRNAPFLILFVLRKKIYLFYQGRCKLREILQKEIFEMKQAFFILLALFSFLSTAQAGNQVSSVISDDLAYPSNCGEALVTSYQSVPASGGTFSFNVTAPPLCRYSIVNILSPAIITSPNFAQGNSTVTFQVQENNQFFTPRYGVIRVGAKTFTVNQGAAKGGPPARRNELDFNRDGNTDFVAIQNNGGNMTWWTYRYHIVPGASISVATFGLFADDIPVPGDYNGDQLADIAVWRSGTASNPQSYFYILDSLSNFVSVIPWGTIGDNPNVTQDFDGDFQADLAVTRKEGGSLVWYIKLTATGSVYVQQFGNANDRPIRGDYDGDFHSDLAVYRPSGGVPANTFFAFHSTSGTVSAATFGVSETDKVVPGDYNGDLKTDFAVWRTTTGVWYWISSADGSITAYQFGLPGDLPVPSNYDGFGKTDYAVFRPSTGEFWVAITNDTSALSYLRWGNSTMKIPAYSMQVQ